MAAVAGSLTMSRKTLANWSDRRLQGVEAEGADVGSGSVAPVRGRRMQSFGSELVPIVGRHERTTAAAIISFLRGASEGHVPR